VVNGSITMRLALARFDSRHTSMFTREFIGSLHHWKRPSGSTLPSSTTAVPNSSRIDQRASLTGWPSAVTTRPSSHARAPLGTSAPHRRRTTSSAVSTSSSDSFVESRAATKCRVAGRAGTPSATSRGSRTVAVYGPGSKSFSSRIPVESILG
jgi:hypothetical protein